MKKIALLAILLIAASLRASTAAENVNTTTAAPANDEVRVGLGVSCDTEAQIKRYTALMAAKDAAQAIQIVNHEARNPRACGAVAIAYKVARQITDVRNEKGMFKIIEIVVIAATSGEGGWQMIRPQPTQYIAVREIEA